MAALTRAKANLAELKDAISRLKTEHSAVAEKTGQLLESVIATVTLRERLKAKLGTGSSSLKAFMTLIENEMEEDSVDPFLLDEYDELDEEYERIKLNQRVSMKMKSFEELLKDAEKLVKDTKGDMNQAADEVFI